MDESNIVGREDLKEDKLRCECHNDLVFLPERSFNTDIPTYKCLGCGTISYVP